MSRLLVRRCSLAPLLAAALMLAGCDDAPPGSDAGPEDSGVDIGPCVPGAELCNGVDDNCNDEVDEGPALVLCPTEDGTPVCHGDGTCSIETCADSAHADCNGVFADGCEADLASWRTCGTCDNACATGSACDDGECVADAPREVVCGASHTCVRMASGSVYCWGSNASSQLGTDAVLDWTSAPTLVAAEANVVQLALGDGHSCALRANGTMECWGNDSSSQLGDGLTTETATPVAVAGLAGIVQITAGAQHSCALTDVGSVYCWGLDDTGQVTGTSASSGEPVTTPTEVTTAAAAVQVAAGAAHTCAVLVDGDAYCWGDDSSGQLGDGTGDSTGTGLRKVGMLASNILAVAAGNSHSCFYRVGTSGSPNPHIRCNGANDRLQIGLEGTEDVDSPATQIASATGASGLAYVLSTRAWNHTCELTTTRDLVCWGAGTSGQLGNAAVDDATPVLTTGFSDATSVCAGENHTCAIDRTGSVYCWGDNASGQLGIGTVASNSAPGDPVQLP